MPAEFNISDSCVKDRGTGNKVLGVKPAIKDSHIVFEGNYNTIYCEDDVKISDSNICFQGNNSLVILREGSYCLNAKLGTASVIHIGKNNYFNPYEQHVRLLVFEHKNIFIGDNNNFAKGITMRTADAHLIYDNDTNERINHSKSIYIGDHAWIGQDSMILKGSKIHSGSVTGAQSVVAGKNIYSNSIYAGNPIKQLKTNIHWDEQCTNLWTEGQTEKNSIDFEPDNSIFAFDEKQYISFESIEKFISECDSNKEILDYLINLPQDKNRFAYFG